MSKIPAGLLHLTIYNPSLRPASQFAPDDEDAAEQAHILFYTARERAVSRDRMLRQVGLAKALINFSEIFSPEQPCENVHTQTSRMIMVSPEPDYWIHACFELAKVPRNASLKTRSNGKVNERSVRQETAYDFQDASIHDIALRKHILRGYEEFKLTHGSFTAILSAAGQEALELQLERFFTVWAWKWDVEKDADFISYLGVPLHPLSSALTPIIDDFSSHIPSDSCAFALSPPYVIPSTSFSTAHYPTSLSRHIITRITPSPPPASDAASSSQTATNSPVETIRTMSQSPQNIPSRSAAEKRADVSSVGGNSAFTMMPSVSVGVDVRHLKWAWPEYLTFGKTSSVKTSSVPATPSSPSSNAVASPSSMQGHLQDNLEHSNSKLDDSRSQRSIDVDAEALREAISTDYVQTPSAYQRSPATPSTPLDTQQEMLAAGPTDTDAAPAARIHIQEPDSQEGNMDQIEAPLHDLDMETETKAQRSEESPSSPPTTPSPVFVPTTVYLAESTDSEVTQRKRVWHLTTARLTIALVTKYDTLLELPSLAEKAVQTLAAVRSTVIKETEKRSGETPSIPTATKILQQQDMHVISVNGFTTTSTSNFTSNSEHFFNAQQILQDDSDVSEVFSRGQNPQHWHVAKRGLGLTEEGHGVNGEVFMEIARKESTLTDIDNALAAVVRKFVEQSGTM